MACSDLGGMSDYFFFLFSEDKRENTGRTIVLGSHWLDKKYIGRWDFFQ